MYTYKCYFHPKEDGAQGCKGCKLPVCAGCFGPEGFCPECTQRRDSIHHLKQMRAARSLQQAASATGRLRLAHAVGSGTLVAGSAHAPAASTRQMPPVAGRTGHPAGAQRGAAPSRPAAPARTPSRPLAPIRDQFTAAPRAAAVTPQPRRYNPDNVAYKPVVPAASLAKPAASSRSWGTPFLVGLTVGAAVVVAGYFGLGVGQETASHPVAHPVAGSSLLGRFESAIEQAPRL